MGSRAEAVFDGTESYDPQKEYRRQQTLLKLASACCHFCFRSAPDVTIVYGKDANDMYSTYTVAPSCTECMKECGVDPDHEEVALEREHSRSARERR
jgi:hypothetical protein